MKSHVTRDFQKCLFRLPYDVQCYAKVSFSLWQNPPHHPSLRFKRVHTSEPIYSTRVGRHDRTLGVKKGEHMIWFWIGSHDDYMKIIARL